MQKSNTHSAYVLRFTWYMYIILQRNKRLQTITIRPSIKPASWTSNTQKQEQNRKKERRLAWLLTELHNNAEYTHNVILLSRVSTQRYAYFFDATDAGDARKVRNNATDVVIVCNATDVVIVCKRRDGENARIEAVSILALRALNTLRPLCWVETRLLAWL